MANNDDSLKNYTTIPGVKFRNDGNNDQVVLLATGETSSVMILDGRVFTNVTQEQIAWIARACGVLQEDWERDLVLPEPANQEQTANQQAKFDRLIQRMEEYSAKYPDGLKEETCRALLKCFETAKYSDMSVEAVKNRAEEAKIPKTMHRSLIPTTDIKVIYDGSLVKLDTSLIEHQTRGTVVGVPLFRSLGMDAHKEAKDEHNGTRVDQAGDRKQRNREFQEQEHGAIVGAVTYADRTTAEAAASGTATATNTGGEATPSSHGRGHDSDSKKNNEGATPETAILISDERATLSQEDEDDEDCHSPGVPSIDQSLRTIEEQCEQLRVTRAEFIYASLLCIDPKYFANCVKHSLKSPKALYQSMKKEFSSTTNYKRKKQGTDEDKTGGADA